MEFRGNLPIEVIKLKI